MDKTHLIYEIYRDDKAVLGFFVQGRPWSFMSRYVFKQLDAHLVGFEKIEDIFILEIEYPPDVAKMIVEELRRPGCSVPRPVWG